MHVTRQIHFLVKHKAVPEQLRFQKRATTVLTSNIFEIHKRISIINNTQTLHLYQISKTL